MRSGHRIFERRREKWYRVGQSTMCVARSSDEEDLVLRFKENRHDLLLGPVDPLDALTEHPGGGLVVAHRSSAAHASAVTLSGAATVESWFLQASHLGFAVVPKQQQSGRRRSTAAKAEVSSLDELRAELAAVTADLEALRLAHEAQARHLIIERLAVAENAAALLAELDELKADVEWRTGVMKTYEDQLETLRNSRSLRYSASLRRVAGALRSRRS